MDKEDSQQPSPVLTAERIQAAINEKLSEESSFFLTDRLLWKWRRAGEKVRDRTCGKMCAGFVFVGIALASTLLITLIMSRLFASPSGVCDMRCKLRTATWAALSEAQVERLGSLSPDQALDALSAAYIENHAAQFAQAHQQKHEVHRLQDAHERMADQLQDAGAQWKQVLAMPDGPEKVAKLKDIISTSGEVEAMAGEVKNGKSFNEVKLKKMTAADAYEVRACAEVLRTVGIEPCVEESGTVTGFLRALGAGFTNMGGQQPELEPPSPIWPINMQYPGLRTLDAKNGIHVIDGFLSHDECNALIQNSTTVRVQNRSSITEGSFIALHSKSSHHKQKQEKHKQKRVPKWMYAGMPGALIELDMKGQGMKGQKDCKPWGNAQTADADDWKEAIEQQFQDRGQDLDKCQKNGFGDTRFFDVACPLATSPMEQATMKVAKLVQASPTQLQPLKLFHYGRGDFDQDHYDTDHQNTNGKVAPMMTVIMYLSDVKGGGTYFPHLDLRVDPMPGRLLIFPTMTMNLTQVAASLHAEEEVKRGDKWVLGTSVFLGRREDCPNAC